jgi:hypothetical protein
MGLSTDLFPIDKLGAGDFHPANRPGRCLQVHPSVRILSDGVSDQCSAKGSGSGENRDRRKDNCCGKQAFHADLDAGQTFVAVSEISLP